MGVAQRGVRSKARGRSTRMPGSASPPPRLPGRSRTAVPYATRHVGRRCYLTEQPALGKTNVVKTRFGSPSSIANARGFGCESGPVPMR
ncbi:unnamed protein product [Arctia plantaginis]|uniref:Uncharacterized protein n=1 Tax=Arctia plantaginis TaxID=874455 RepID=A0A8S1B541_ARCPL|nr:unnamed protein product [Arctia plantaginis]